jgi:hypothetical protein
LVLINDCDWYVISGTLGVHCCHCPICTDVSYSYTYIHSHTHILLIYTIYLTPPHSHRELMDGIEYKLEPNDTIVFISTLHGG